MWDPACQLKHLLSEKQSSLLTGWCFVFFRFLYSELMKYDPSNPSSAEESIFEQAGGQKLKIKSSVTFHLYVRLVGRVE